MKLYRVYNGYMGFGPVHVLVIADSNNQARGLASEAFKKVGGERYGESYYRPSKLEVELITDDLSKLFVREVDEG